MMVQKRQIRVQHVDAHYCVASWKYLREYAVKHRDLVNLVSMDDKHKIKCRESSYPVAAAERGKKVIVGKNQVMSAADHDFTKFSLVPSVHLFIDIPDDISQSFYRGDVHIGFKESAFEPSSALRHSTELKELIIQREGPVPPALLLYTDGGPDHRVNYLSVKVALIAFFRDLDLDLLIALRTAPSNSWANPVERIMSIVNIGLQGVGMMRRKMSDEFERVVSKASSVKEVREAVKTDELRQEMKETMAFPKELLNSQMKRLALKGKSFQVFDAASGTSIDDLWTKCQEIDRDLKRDKTTKKDLKNYHSLKSFLKNHCKETHYTFQIKKCSSESCDFCGKILNCLKEVKDNAGGIRFCFRQNNVQLPHGVEVFVRDHDCLDLVEKLYYSCGYEPICIYCGWYLSDADENADTYPQCVDCDGPEIPKRNKQHAEWTYLMMKVR
ncbi:uncharacterized protein [Clytia hemisphaerica]|uniref:uncharacterized protein n=1 Tax=Clytia hemisphaerica TaxID=252671 RepID=UPI0034D515D0